MAKRKPADRESPASPGAEDGRLQTAPAVSLNALREQAALLRHAQALAQLAHVITRPDGSFEAWSETLPALIGIPAAEIVSSTREWLGLVHPADRRAFRDVAISARKNGERARVEYRIWRRDSGWVHLRQVMEPIPGAPDAQGRRRWFNTLQDVTGEKHAQERISRLNRLYSMLSGINALVLRVRSRDRIFAEACEVAVRHGAFRAAWIAVRAEDGLVRPVAWSGDLGALFADPPASIVECDPAYKPFSVRAVAEGRAIVSADYGLEGYPKAKEVLKALGVSRVAAIPLRVNGSVMGVLTLYAQDASYFDDEELRLLLDLGGDVAFAIEYLDKSEKAEYLAYHDPVTDLPNRPRFLERLTDQLATARIAGTKAALLMLDLERFRLVNDALGRVAGDTLLRGVAERLLQAAPGRNVARVGADQFAIGVTDVASAEDLMRMVQSGTKHLFAEPFRLNHEEVRLTARLGIALYPEDAADAEKLFRNAEAALKKAKQAGEPYLFYEPGMSERVSERLSLENRLHRALEQRQFVLHYQPKVRVDTREVTGVEALIRWRDPELGLVPPAQFVPVLEATGLIVSVGAWALEQAARDHRLLAKVGSAAPRIAVNISAAQLRHRDFMATFEALARREVVPSAVGLEITESVLMEDIDAGMRNLRKIRELGFELAMDDFGTGYSSLAYLARLPINALKVDRSFVSSMQEDPDAMTLVSTMVSLAHSMKLRVIAEGVETEDQARMLRLLRCDEMQGFLISKPLPLDELALFLDAER